MPSPEDRPDPNERTAVRARVPDHVATGNVSTGVIVVTGGTEFVLDFVRNLPRPAMVVARVVMPHAVMPQFVDALANNVAIFRQRFGDAALGTAPAKTFVASDVTSQAIVSAQNPVPVTEPPKTAAIGSDRESEPRGDASHHGSRGGGGSSGGPESHPENAAPSDHSGSSNQPNGPVRQPSPQEVYDDLKLKDELLSGRMRMQ